MKNNTKKTNKKVFTPIYTVDISNCETVSDALLAFAEAKQAAKQPLTDAELEAIVDDRSYFIVVENVCTLYEEKKLPWYKKLWNKVRHPFS